MGVARWSFPLLMVISSLTVKAFVPPHPARSFAPGACSSGEHNRCNRSLLLRYVYCIQFLEIDLNDHAGPLTRHLVVYFTAMKIHDAMMRVDSSNIC